MELSFVDEDDVMDVNERLLQKLFKEILDVDIELPIQRMTWQEAMDRFGSDKPDLRFGMELKDVSEVVKGCGFGVFTGALENGGSVRGINAKGQGGMPRKKIDALVKFAKDFGAKGLAYLAINEDGTYKSSFAKFMTDDELKALVDAMEGEPGDLLLFAADKNKIVWDVLGNLSLRLQKILTFLTRMFTNSSGLQSSLSLSIQKNREDTLQCTIRSLCRSRMIFSTLSQILKKFVREHMTLFLTEQRLVEVLFVSIRMMFRRRCFVHLDLLMRKHTSSSVSFSMRLSMEYRHTQDWPMVLTDLS